MRNFLVLFIIAMMVSSAVSAQDEAPLSQDAAALQNFVLGKVDEFINTVKNEVPGQIGGQPNPILANLDEHKDAMVAEVTNLVTDISDSEAQDVLSRATDYFNGEKNAINQAVSQLFNNNSDFPNQGNAREEYFQEMANLNRFFLIDMQEEEKQFTQVDYDRDFLAAQQRAQSILEGLNAPTLDDLKSNANTGAPFNASDFLDRGAPLVQRRTVQLEVIRTGVDNRLAADNIFQIVSNFRNKFPASQFPALAEALDFFLSVWPQATEALYIDGASVDNNVFDDIGDIVGKGKGRSGLQDNFVNQDIIINESGQVIQQDPTDDGFDTRFSEDLENATFVSSRDDRIFNSRQFGGRALPSGRNEFPTIRLTTNRQTFELRDIVFASPLVLDMDGDGRLEASGGEWMPHKTPKSRIVAFDILGDGFDELIEWVGPNDGLLLVYNKGEEVNANNLFGEAGGFLHGYEKLSLLDQNNDKVLSGEELITLSVWQDRNENAKVDNGEVTSVQDLGITSINVTHERYVSSFVQEGKEKTMWDWYPCVFRVKKKK